jgi:hypothetical protein
MTRFCRLCCKSRRELLKQFAPQYRQASSAQKRVLLDTFAQGTSYHRRYGMWLLNHADVQTCEPLRSRSPTCAAPALERRQLHLRQTAHPLSPHIH